MKYSGLLVMCEKGGLKGREPLKLCIRIAKENGKREEKDTWWRIGGHAHRRSISSLLLFVKVYPIRDSFRSVRRYPNLAIIHNRVIRKILSKKKVLANPRQTWICIKKRAKKNFDEFWKTIYSRILHVKYVAIKKLCHIFQSFPKVLICSPHISFVLLHTFNKQHKWL